MADNNRRPATSTQIRNLYSEGLSYINITFYNMNLSFSFQPFMNKDQNGRSNYDRQNSITTTIGWDSAFALYKVACDIIEGKEASKGITIFITCNGGVVITLEHKPSQSGSMETIMTITKNGQTIPFKFSTHQMKINENGQMVVKTVESGLGAFAKTIDGYLTGINADRHLDKLTEDYVKSLGANANGGQGQQGFQTGSGYKGGGNNYNNKNGYKKPYNNNRGGYNNNYNNNQNQGGAPQQTWESQQPTQNQQNMSTYNIPNN